MFKSILIIAAHPDDEVLGCGGAIASYTAQGVPVNIIFLADGISSRDAHNISELECRHLAAKKAAHCLGISDISFSDFPDNQLDTVPLLSIVKQVEQAIARYRPDTVFTHHVGDVNIDHQKVHQAVVTACRPQPQHPVKTLLFFEVASSTEWQPPGSAPNFQPNWFIDISHTLTLKQQALAFYKEELRPFPHSRSQEAVTALARWRGATVGVKAAEAFILGRHLDESSH